MGIRHVDVEAGPTGIAMRVSSGGEVWTIDWGAEQVNVKDSRGIRLLARLVEQPGVDVHVLALASDDGESAPESSAGEVLDRRARDAYRRRIAEIAELLAEATHAGDARRSAALAYEHDALNAELARASGLGGRVRQTGSTTERARINVRKRIKDAIGRITRVDARLGRFLGNAIRTGTYCCFRPMTNLDANNCSTSRHA